MYTYQGQAPLQGGNHSNLSPHNVPSRGGHLAFFTKLGHIFSHGEEPLAKIWPQGLVQLNPSPADVSPPKVFAMPVLTFHSRGE